MKLPLHIAKKLRRLLSADEGLASSSMQHAVVTRMLEDGLLQKQQLSKTKALLFFAQKENVPAYLHNHFGITNLDQYIALLEKEEPGRAGNIAVSGNSKLQQVRTFRGFLVNCYDEIPAMLGGQAMQIKPLPGSYTFIHDYEHFLPSSNVTIIGIENAENFRAIEQQRYLFPGITPLFVSRYPQSNDLIKWLMSIPNPYLHFGDLDFAGISIYQHEFKKHLGDRASFFAPPNLEQHLEKFGNRALFNKQYNPLSNYTTDAEPGIVQVLQALLKHKKVLEQEVFIGQVF